MSDEFGRVSGRRIGEAIDAHVVPSTNATYGYWRIIRPLGPAWSFPETITNTELPIDNTLEFNASEELSVNVQDVIEHSARAHPVLYTNVRELLPVTLAQPLGKPMRLVQYRQGTITKVEVLLNAAWSGADGYYGPPRRG